MPTCPCGIITNQRDGVCIVCRMEDRDPDLHSELGLYRVRFSRGDVPKRMWGKDGGNRGASLRRAGLAAGRRTTMKGYITRGAEVLRLMRQGLLPNQIFAAMLPQDPKLTRGAVGHWCAKHRRSGRV